MRKIIRGRLLAGMLAAALLCTAVPETAYADDSETIAVASVNGYSRESAVEWIKGKT